MTKRADPVTAADLRACFRGDVYGDAASMTDAWFADHVARNDIDLEVSPRWTVNGELSAIALLGFRGDRAWIGGFGVVPAARGHGMGGVCVADVLGIARDEGAATIELEVLENNPAAIRMYERGGFEEIGQLVVWEREWLSGAVPDRGGATVDERPLDAGALAAIATGPASCWQRELRSVAAAAPFVTLTVGGATPPAAYAFVRPGASRDAAVLDAGASDYASGDALFSSLDARFGASTLTLVNEPLEGQLHEALLGQVFWNATAFQRRMRMRLR